ncbi:MAG TPA: hypothetical protein VHK88_17920 [Aquihabitans sp.]|jgi:hypothetical protein|nr:hypothetical protein [Aquihabitans sp.]
MTAGGRAALLAGPAAALASFSGCAVEQDAGRNAVCAAVEHAVPSDTLQDLVTYADEVAVIDVVDQKIIEHDEPNDGLEPTRYRDVTATVVDVVWKAPQNRAVPQSFTFTTGGWKDGPAPVCDQPGLELGRRYLVGMVEYRKGEWAPMTGPFLLEVSDRGTLDGVVQDGPLAPYHGRTRADVGAALADVAPHPAVAPFMGEPGGVRDDRAQGG